MRPRFRKMRADKSVSLNEVARQKEKAELKARTEAAKKDRLARAAKTPAAYQVTLNNLSKPGLSELVKPKTPHVTLDADPDNDVETAVAPANDVILHEAQSILIDYSSLLKGQPVISQR